MNRRPTQLPLFKVVLVEPELTVLGFQWIEVLGFLPFRASPVMMECACPDCDETAQGWMYSSWVIVRTEHGLGQLTEEDLFPEINEGYYVEEGTPAEVIQKNRKLRREREEYCAAHHEDEEEHGDCH